jgi:hypothetical protein
MKALLMALVLALVAGITTVSSAAFAKADMLDFEGAYRLQRSVLGQCETLLAVYRQDDDENYRNMFAGSYTFRNVDGGSFVAVDDYFYKRTVRSYVRGNVLEQRETIYNKPLKRTETRRFGIRRTGKRLELWSYNSFNAALPTKCVYKWVSDSPLDLPE